MRNMLSAWPQSVEYFFTSDSNLGYTQIGDNWNALVDPAGQKCKCAHGKIACYRIKITALGIAREPFVDFAYFIVNKHIGRLPSLCCCRPRNADSHNGGTALYLIV